MGAGPFTFGGRGGGSGGGGGPVDASEVTYHSDDFPTVEDALDALLYVAPVVTSMTNNIGTVELGSTIGSIDLSWAINKDVTSQSIDNGVGTIPAVDRAVTVTGSFSADTTWTLTVSDGETNATGNTSLLFRRKRYWGASASTSLDNSGVLGLSNNEYATSKNKSVTYDATGGKYPYYAYPVAFGSLSAVTVGGLSFSDYTVDTLSFTNSSGHTEDYYVVRFNGIQTGSNIQVVWA